MPDETVQEAELGEFITAREAATLLRLESPWTIYALRRERKLVGYTIGGKNTLRFRKRDVLALLQPTTYVPQENHGRRPQPAGR